MDAMVVSESMKRFADASTLFIKGQRKEQAVTVTPHNAVNNTEPTAKLEF